MKYETIIDISWPITLDMTTYKDNKPATFIHEKNFQDHQVCDSTIKLNSHTGTHIDAPSHFLSNGTTVETVSLKTLVGPCRILNLTHLEDRITDKDLEPHNIQANEIILLKTKNSNTGPTDLFNKKFIFLEKTGAYFLATKNIKTVGIDYLGIEREQPDHETHRILFEHNITIIEGLRLQQTLKSHYFLCCLPLAINNLEAAPARAILLD